MTRSKKTFRFVAAMAVATSLWAPALQAQTLNLTPNEVRALAQASLQAGQAREAAIASDALLNRFPDDAQTLLLRTEAAISLGDYAGAVSFGRRAFWNAQTDRQRFNAARLTALGHARQEQFNQAQLWLRGARQFAPTDAAAQAVAEDFRTVRSQNPLSVSLRFGITPSTNINGGSFNDTIDVFFLGQLLPFELSADAQALSGWEYSGSVALRYRVRTDDTSATFLDFGLSGVTYTLTENSRDSLEGLDIDGSTFSNARVRFGVSHRFVLAPGANVTEASLSYARSFRKDEDERHFVTASVSHRFTLNEATLLTVTGASERQEYVEGGDQSQSYRVQANVRRAVSDFGFVSLGYAVEASAADRSTDEFEAVTYSLGFAPAEPIFNVNWGVSVSYREVDWDFYNNFAGARDDEVTTVTANATFRDVEVFGFNPTMSVSHQVRDSSNTLFESDSTTVAFDIVSSF